MSRRIEIVEVGPRDGLQNEKAILEVDREAGVHPPARGRRRSGAWRPSRFVNPNRVPQMAGAEEIIRPPCRRRLGRSRIGLVLNVRGLGALRGRRLRRGQCGGLRHRRLRHPQPGRLGRRAGRRPWPRSSSSQAAEGGPPITVTISVAFGCPFDGEVSEDQVVAIARDAARPGRGRDRAGRHHRRRRSLDRAPARSRRRARPRRDTRLRMHFHDTRNTGLANAFASVEAGVDVLDASVGGLGGCPFAPNATGNIGTEDLVYMLERAGFETGYDLDGADRWVLRQRKWMAAILGKPPAASVSPRGTFP